MRKKKNSLLVLCLVAAHFATGQSLKSVLLNQLKSTHDKENWFVPVSTALEGLTAEQAAWSDGSGNHSVGQLANHLLFWNERQLQKFRGQQSAPFNGNNDETFNAFTKEQWAETIKNLRNVLSDLEKMVENADEASLKSWAETIANISAHNAYHTGQIIYVRKLQGSWNPKK
jgi:uncharacterized damage-inducible protein DinB